jgi:hypothetical protein
MRYATGRKRQTAGKWQRIICCLLPTACCLLLLPAALADFNLKDWAKWREIAIPDKTAPGDYALVELDGPVFAGAQAGLDDLRVVDEGGVEVPSKVIVERDDAREEVRQRQMLDPVLAPDGRSSFALDLGADAQRHNRLRLETASRNFSRRVTIDASADNRAWALLRGDGYIFDFSRDTTARFLTIDYPLSTQRYLRVTVWNHQEKPVEITGASVSFVTEKTARLKLLPAALVSRSEDAKLRASVLALDLHHPWPSTRLELQMAASNFHRRVEIEGSRTQQSWTRVGGGEIFTIEIDRVKRQQLQIDYREAQFRYLRVKIFNYDDQPLKLDEARVYGSPRYLLFRREAGKSYRLFYGNPAAAAPRYDLAQLSPYLQIEQLSKLTLTAERGVEAAAPRAEPWLERQPLWLWATLALATAVLGTLIYRLAKQSAGR